MRRYNPRPYESRLKSGFLFFPKGMLSSETRWLEWATWRETYQTGIGWIFDGWINE